MTNALYNFVIGGFFGASLTILYLCRSRESFLAITITDPGPTKIQVIKAIRATNGMGIRDAKDASEGKPFVVEKKNAEALARELRNLSATVRTRRAHKRDEWLY